MNSLPERFKRIRYFERIAMIDEKLLGKLESSQKGLEFVLKLNEKKYPLTDVTITKYPNPVDKPTTRGGVYITGKFSFKIKGTIHDTSIIPELTETMLGPNTDFKELTVDTALDDAPVTITTNLTNSMHNSEKIELNMAIVGLK